MSMSNEAIIEIRKNDLPERAKNAIAELMNEAAADVNPAAVIIKNIKDLSHEFGREIVQPISTAIVECKWAETRQKEEICDLLEKALNGDTEHDVALAEKLDSLLNRKEIEKTKRVEIRWKGVNENVQAVGNLGKEGIGAAKELGEEGIDAAKEIFEETMGGFIKIVSLPFELVNGLIKGGFDLANDIIRQHRTKLAQRRKK